MIHLEESALAGKEIQIKRGVNEIGGCKIVIEDWWDRVGGVSWMFANGNIGCVEYAIRTAYSGICVPIDDEVLYGKIGVWGYLVHVNELELKED